MKVKKKKKKEKRMEKTTDLTSNFTRVKVRCIEISNSFLSFMVCTKSDESKLATFTISELNKQNNTTVKILNKCPQRVG